MAQVVPSLTSLPIDSTVAPSAEDIQNRLPSICVDYLSHDWQEEDVWASWRSMTRHKNEIANGVRLENASWRTWWKQRNKLRTISPETLNWLKDSDVTWLYGPLHTAVEPVPPTKIATAEERLGIVRHDSSTTQFSSNSNNSANSANAPTKPILKHRTLSEMLTIPMPASPVLEAVQNDTIDDYDVEEGRPGLLHTKSDTNIVRAGLRKRASPPRGPIGSGNRTPINPAEMSQPGSGQRTPEGPPLSAGKKHISFNTFVEQCIAVDDPAEIPGIEEEADDTEDDEEDDGMLEMRSSSSASSSRSSRSSSRPSLSRHSSSSSQPEHMTIAKIAPTKLKALGSFPSPSPQIIYAPPEEYAAEHDDATGITYRHSPSPGSERWGYNPPGGPDEQAQKAQRIAVSPTWDDEDDYSVGFDYFSGPDLGVGDEYNTGQRAGGTRQVQSHVGSGASYGKGQQAQQGSASTSQTNTPTVNQAPPQPRWRAGSSSEEPSSTSSSNNSTARPTPVQSPGGEIMGAVSPPQPGRSILKIRPPGHQAPEPADLSPTSSYFNFKPSAATGLGGLDQGVRRVIKEPAAGSLPLYDQADNAYFVQPGNPANNGPITTVQTPPLASPHSVPTSPAYPRSEEPESRGRSSTRAGSTSSLDKSTSRGSVASVSVSPSSARSPVQNPGGGAKYQRSSQNDPTAGTVKSPTQSPGQKQAGNVNPAQVQAAPPPQVPTPVGMSAPKDDVELKKEENVKKREEDKQQAEAEAEIESRGQEYVPERSSTPTPHSSPQITVRRMTDTSPSSLPHTQTFHIPDKAAAGTMGAVEAAENSAKTASAKRHSRVASLPNAGSVEPGMFRRSVSQSGGEDDGGLMSNIASTAKDLFGALWNYGGQPATSATTTANGNVQQDKSSSD